MFIGRYYHRMEEKGRVLIPKTFRDDSKDWIVTRGLDGGIFMFRPETFNKQVEELSERTFTKKRHRDFIRYLVNDAKAVTTDKLGRVLLPEYLISFAGLNREVVVVGSFEYLEVWDQERYHQYLDTLESSGEKLAESLEND